VNKAAFDALPEELRVVVTSAARVANQDMYAEYIARNNQALQTLVDEHRVEVRRLPDSVLERLRELSAQVVAEIAQKDDLSKRVYDSFQRFREQAVAWSSISQLAYLTARSA
jgi:TRAP-type mannitol/chloroaromatic compound transport system substrate-binding protein